MTAEHLPIDFKDDSPEYRARVWNAVRQRIGSELTPLPANSTFTGIWNVEFDLMGIRQPMYRYDFRPDMAVIISGDNIQPQAERFSVPGDGRVVVAGETYHAATTDQGELVLFNGDQSLVLIATQCEREDSNP